MVGIILMSHGNMAEGLLHTSTLFFGEPVQMKALCLQADDNPEEFDQKIKDAIAELDDGSGVIGLCDLLFGSPCNRSIYCLSDNFKVVTGMSLPMLMTVLTKRSCAENVSEIEIEELIEETKSGIVDLNEMIKQQANQ